MSDEIIHLEETIRSESASGTREPPKVFWENCFERCFPVASKRRPGTSGRKAGKLGDGIHGIAGEAWQLSRFRAERSA